MLVLTSEWREQMRNRQADYFRCPEIHYLFTISLSPTLNYKASSTK